MKYFYFFPLFILTSAFAKPCGLLGSVDERIKDCAQTKGNFALVAVNEKEQEIYKDLKTGLLWGSRITTDFNHYGSQKACAEEGGGNQALSSLRWRLPSINEFEVAATHGMKAALPNMDQYFWSSTPFRSRKFRRKRGQPALVYIWDGSGEKTDTGDLKDAASVRCVARD